MRVHDHGHACSGPQNYVEQMAGVPTDGFDGIFLSHSRTDSSWLAVYQNHFDRITSTVSQGSDPRTPDPFCKMPVVPAAPPEPTTDSGGFAAPSHHHLLWQMCMDILLPKNRKARRTGPQSHNDFGI